jgi:hypothetical protein
MLSAAMKLMLIALLLAAPLADGSDLVKAAKKKPARGVITNVTVKKNATPSSGGANAAPAPLPVPKSEIALKEEERKQREAAEARLRDAETAVATLEREIAAVELSYYEENDPDVRDREITRKFAATKGKLAVARKDLDAAREALAKLPPKTILIDSKP